MPVFHTKTIQMILEPVAEQVSTLVLIHEQGKDGNQMPDLINPILTVKAAVSNLVKVGKDQIKDTKDEILKLDTPPALEKVETSADMLVQASQLLSIDQKRETAEMTPEGMEGRKKLIAGSRGILQGTSDLLLVFDEAEVRRICKVCRNVRDYLNQSSIVAGMEDLVVFVKSLTPGTTTLARMIGDRCKDLTNQNHVAALTEEMDQVKAYIPGLISSLKAFVQTVDKPGKAQEAAIGNREYYTTQISERITEIIRLLQLVSTDDANTDPLNVLQLKQTQQKMARKMQPAKNWLNNPNAPAGGPGELALREILDGAKEIGNQAGGPLGDKILGTTAHLGTLTDQLSDLRANGKGNSAEAKQIATQINGELDQLMEDVDDAIEAMDKLAMAHSGMVKTMPAAREWLANLSAKPKEGAEHVHNVTKAGREIAMGLGSCKDRDDIIQLCDEIDDMMQKLEEFRTLGLGDTPEAVALSKSIADKLTALNAKVAKALASKKSVATLDSKMEEIARWLDNPGVKDGGRGLARTKSLLGDARQIAARISDPNARFALLKNVAECDRLLKDLEHLIQTGRGDSKEAKEIAKKLQKKLEEVKKQMKDALVRAVADEFADTTTSLKQLHSAAIAPLDTLNREENFEGKALTFQSQSTRLADLARQAVGASDLVSQEKVDEVKKKAVRIEGLTPQVINAGRIVLSNPENKTSLEHFETLKQDWTRNMDELTDMVDDSVDFATFMDASEESMRREHEACVKAVKLDKPADALPLAGNISRRAHRILMTGKREMQNTDDPQYVEQLRKNLNAIQQQLDPTLKSARTYAGAPANRKNQNDFIDNEDKLIQAVSNLQKTVKAEIIEKEKQRKALEEPPPVPPMPVCQTELPPPVPPPPEEEFPEVESNQPIMVAAKELHEEAKKWESTGNNIIAAAKKMALLMAKMSRLVDGEEGSRSELIQCAKDIAKASNDVTKYAKEVATQCTDKRIKTDMMKTLDRLPTISTQLRILSTVKATTLGNPSQEKEEDAEQATEMLVHNAQNLMQSVKETVRYAEAASIRIRTDAGLTMRWVRKDN
ncbi:vinculin-like [Styela clava]